MLCRHPECSKNDKSKKGGPGLLGGSEKTKTKTSGGGGDRRASSPSAASFHFVFLLIDPVLGYYYYYRYFNYRTSAMGKVFVHPRLLLQPTPNLL